MEVLKDLPRGLIGVCAKGREVNVQSSNSARHDFELNYFGHSRKYNNWGSRDTGQDAIGMLFVTYHQRLTIISSCIDLVESCHQV